MSSQPPREPRNVFYLLLLIVSAVFAINAVAYAVVPVLEEKAREAGEFPPPSPLRDALRSDGWKWLLAEVAAMVVFGLLSMGLDRLRRHRQEQAEAAAKTPADPAAPAPSNAP